MAHVVTCGSAVLPESNICSRFGAANTDRVARVHWMMPCCGGRRSSFTIKTQNETEKNTMIGTRKSKSLDLRNS